MSQNFKNFIICFLFYLNLPFTSQTWSTWSNPVTSSKSCFGPNLSCFVTWKAKCLSKKILRDQVYTFRELEGPTTYFSFWKIVENVNHVYKIYLYIAKYVCVIPEKYSYKNKLLYVENVHKFQNCVREIFQKNICMMYRKKFA